MKIQQENHPYRPVTIKLEKKHEAKAFFDLVDKLDEYVADGEHFHIDSNERGVIHTLSNALTNMEIII